MEVGQSLGEMTGGEVVGLHEGSFVRGLGGSSGMDDEGPCLAAARCGKGVNLLLQAVGIVKRQGDEVDALIGEPSARRGGSYTCPYLIARG